MPSATLTEKEGLGTFLSPGEKRGAVETERAVSEEMMLILLKLHLEVMYKLSR